MDAANERFADRIAIALRYAVSWLQDCVRRDNYRPERHYMRGPGPKSRAKACREA
jgi:hypothetical protein